MATWADTLKAAIGASAEITPQQAGEIAASDPTSFFGQKVVAVELQEPGLQFFSSPEQAAGTTTAVMQHLQSPSAMDTVAPFFAVSPYTAPIYAAYRLGQDGDTALAQLQQRIEEAKKWATSSAGSVIRQAASGAASLPQLPDFGTISQGYLGLMAQMFSPRMYQDSISEVLASIRGTYSPASFNNFLRAGRTSILRRARRVLTVEDL